MTIATPQASHEVGNLLVGEVWLCVGQSNMEWPVRLSEAAEATLASADRPTIRHVRVGLAHAGEPQERVGIHWETATPQTVGTWSAVAYYFALRLQEKMDVPVGLVNASWGGTLIEPWIPKAGYDATPSIRGVYLDPVYANWGEHQVPARLYNGMIHPLAPYGLRGVLWYQGEGNHYDALLYPDKFRALLESWRRQWNQPAMPAYFVQLAPYTYFDPKQFPDSHPNKQVLAQFWEAQNRIVEKMSHVGMVVINDLGDPQDIHPRRKREVGRRLANLALQDTYGQSMGLVEGPRFKQIRPHGHQLVLTFDQVGDGLASRDGKPLSHFEISEDEQSWHVAEVRMIGKATLVLEAQGVRRPRAMRFAWHETAEPNLVNGVGLPCSAFRAAWGQTRVPQAQSRP